jgi:serine/threonine protein phosphatase 1
MACYVVGDIHGCLSELACLVENLPLKPADRIVFLGDYIDRGPDSKGVIDYLLGMTKAVPNEMIFLKGNHEDMLLSYLGFNGNYGDMFLANGGNATLASYGIPPLSTSQDCATARIPASHLNFLLGLRSYYIYESFLCVHAGIQPLKPLESQREVDMLWIRNEFIGYPHRLRFTVIFGHTPQADVFFDLPSKIGIDTGVVYGRKLSCIELDGKELFQIERGARQIQHKSIRHLWSSQSRSATP